VKDTNESSEGSADPSCLLKQVALFAFIAGKKQVVKVLSVKYKNRYEPIGVGEVSSLEA